MQADRAETPVPEAGSSEPVVTIAADAPLEYAADLLAARHVRSLVVVDAAGCRIGAVSLVDVAHEIAAGEAARRNDTI